MCNFYFNCKVRDSFQTDIDNDSPTGKPVGSI